MANTEHGVLRVVNHKDYYLRGGDMTVVVENHLYRIHSHFFHRESSFFRQKMDGPNGNEPVSTELLRYTLDDVKSEDFARFLWVFYNPKFSLYEAPLETWLSILKLANRWNFDNVKELCVRELEKLPIEPVEKIAIYHDHSISRLYLLPSYIALCKRNGPLSFVEGMKLGMETVLRVADARERVRQRASEGGIRSPTFEDLEDEDVSDLIREIFGLGSRPASPSHATIPPNGSNGPQLNPAPSGTRSGNNQRPNGPPGPQSNGNNATNGNTGSSGTTGSNSTNPGANGQGRAQGGGSSGSNGQARGGAPGNNNNNNFGANASHTASPATGSAPTRGQKDLLNSGKP